MDRASDEARVLRQWRIKENQVVLGVGRIDPHDLSAPFGTISRQTSVAVSDQSAADQTHESRLAVGKADHSKLAIEINAALDANGRPLLASDQDVGPPVCQVYGDGGDRVFIRVMFNLQLPYLFDERCLIVGFEHVDELAAYVLAESALDGVARPEESPWRVPRGERHFIAWCKRVQAQVRLGALANAASLVVNLPIDGVRRDHASGRTLDVVEVCETALLVEACVLAVELRESRVRAGESTGCLLDERQAIRLCGFRGAMPGKAMIRAAASPEDIEHVAVVVVDIHQRHGTAIRPHTLVGVRRVDLDHSHRRFANKQLDLPARTIDRASVADLQRVVADGIGRPCMPLRPATGVFRIAEIGEHGDVLCEQANV